MLRKKGFTLIELLATIIILGLLLTIGFISVRSILDRSNDSYYKSQEDMLILAGREYFADHRGELPKDIGGTSKVTLKTLIEEKYIDPIKDKDGIDCDFENSGVTAQKVTNRDYQYYAILACDGYETTKDEAEPVITFTPNKESSQGSIKVTMKVTDNRGVKSYRYVITKDGEEYNDSDYNEYNGDVTINLTELGLYEITGYAIDTAGNSSSKKSGKYSIYKGIDCSEVKFTSNIKENAYTKNNVSISVDVPDNTYRMEISQKTNNENYKLLNSYIGSANQKINISTEGKHQIKVVLYDQDGNSCTATTGSYNIDKTAPNLNVVLKKKNNATDLNASSNISSLANYANNTWYNGYVVSRGSCTDNVGTCTVSYKVTGASSNTSGFVTGTTRNFNAAGISTIVYRATDAAGNVTSKTYTVKLDRSKPTLSVVLKKKNNSTDLNASSNISSLANYANNTWYNGYVVSRGTCGDGNSGCTVSYKVTGASTNTSGYVTGTTRNINAQGTSTVVYRVTDGAGNTVSKTYTIKLDRTRPTVTYNYSGGTYERRSLRVCANMKDSFGIKNARIQVWKPSYPSGTLLKDTGNVTINATSKEACYTLSGYGTYTFYTLLYDYANNKQSKSPENSYGYYYQTYKLENPRSVTVLNDDYYICPEDREIPSKEECTTGLYDTMYVDNVKVTGNTTVSLRVRLHMNSWSVTWEDNQLRTLCIANTNNKCVKNLDTFSIGSPGWLGTGETKTLGIYTIDTSSFSAGDYRVIIDGASQKYRFKNTYGMKNTFRVTG